jgi:DNA mismatch repair protein MutS2
MQLEPKDLYEQLEFDKVLDLLVEECYGELGAKKVAKIRPETQRFAAERKLTETDEYRQTMEEDKFPMTRYEDTVKELRMLEIEDFVLPEDGLKKINTQLRLVKSIFKFFSPQRQKLFPSLFKIIKDIQFDEALGKAIEAVIDEDGNIRPDASPALGGIRKAIGSKTQELERVFRRLITKYRNAGYLTDNVESFRNGRRVLSVPAEHKRKIRGIIHDESTTGKTAFIEPEAVIDINNDIFDLHTDEKKEIYRILKELSATLRPYIEVMRDYQDLIVHFDVVQAKANLAQKMKASKPVLKAEPTLGIQMGKHPLLYLKNKALGQEVVPFDLQLFGKNRMLVVSGPNAGGKSILMKSVGLMQLMVQSGMLVPADEISEFGMFDKIFADIGDQQSIEDDLSTYSSRLKNAKTFIDHADDRTLLLIDEFGSGTDPKIGGAIAEAVLHDLNKRNSFGVITTHYSNLKVYAFKTAGIVNGSMLFSHENLAPTYQLKVGTPGSSFAFEIAEKTGFSKQLLSYARKRTGKNEKAVDELLVDLQRDLQETQQKLKKLEEKEVGLEKLIKNYENLHKDLEYQRKKFKLTQREQELQLTAQNNKEIENLIREIREEANLKKAKELSQTVRVERQERVAEVKNLREEIYYQPLSPKEIEKGEIKVGDFVKMRTGGATGKVQSINKKKAVITMGMMSMEVKLRDIQHANAPLEVRSTKSIKMDTQDTLAAFQPKLDIRGMRLEEAVQTVEVFVDKALVSGHGELRIIHGKGTGALRTAVRRKLREYRAVNNISHPKPEAGGDGVTLVELG